MKPTLVLATILLVASSLAATTTSLTGVLTDSMCTKKHMMSGKSNAECVRICVKDGANYVVVRGDKVYELKGDTKKFYALAGQKVKVSGDLKGNVFLVSAIAPAK